MRAQSLRLLPIALVALAGALALAPVAAGAATTPVSARPPAAAPAAAPVGPDPWVSQVASPDALDYPGWKDRIAALGRARVASPEYAAARQAVGLTARPPITTTFAHLGSALRSFGLGPGRNPRLHVTELPVSGYLHGGFWPVPDGTLAAMAMTGPGRPYVPGHEGPGEAAPLHGTNLSGLYPRTSPVLGTGDTSFAQFLSTRSGRATALAFADADPTSTIDLEVYTPLAPRQQTIVLDVDGATLDTTPYGGRGSATLSPLAAFLPRWGLKRSDATALVARLTQAVAAAVPGPVVVSSDVSDPFGAPGVSRVVIGGTRAQAGVDVIAASAAVDPGNRLHDETSLVLLDRLSEPAASDRRGDEPSINAYLTSASSDRLGFVARALAQVVVHELGHQLGLLDSDDTDTNRTMMDAGGHRFARNLYPLGSDGVGGTLDDDPASSWPYHLEGVAPFHPLQGSVSSYRQVQHPRETLYNAFR